MSDYTTDGKGRNTMVKKLQPKLRFRGFTDAWEQRRLGSLFVQANERNANQELSFGTTISVASMRFNPRGNGAAHSSLSSYKILRRGDIAFEGNRHRSHPFGQLVINDIGDGLMSSRFQSIRPKEPCVISFWKYLLQNERGMRRLLICSTKAGTLMNEFVFGDFSRLDVQLPERDEQEKIGALFRLLDSIIAAEKRKLLLLEQKREAYSQKVFSYGSHHGEDAKHWKMMRLGDIATRITRRNKGRSNFPLTISARDGLIDQRHFFSKQVASKNLDNYILLQHGEFAYNKSTSSDSPWGTIKRLDRYDQGCVSTLYICFSTHSVDSQFITTLFNSPIWHREIQAIATEGARNHGLLNISPKDFFDIRLQIPDSLSEQKHIGRFFAAYEQLIRQTAKRIGLLEKKKKAFLQTMFI